MARPRASKRLAQGPTTRKENLSSPSTEVLRLRLQALNLPIVGSRTQMISTPKRATTLASSRPAKQTRCLQTVPWALSTSFNYPSESEGQSRFGWFPGGWRRQRFSNQRPGRQRSHARRTAGPYCWGLAQGPGTSSDLFIALYERPTTGYSEYRTDVIISGTPRRPDSVRPIRLPSPASP